MVLSDWLITEIRAALFVGAAAMKMLRQGFQIK